MDKEMMQFQEDLLASVKQMNAGQAASVTKTPLSSIVAVRNSAGLSQVQFAKLMGVSVRTLQQWEQGRRSPSGAAKTLLQIAENHPEFLHELAF
jgi:putative transcriptional regulator